MSYHPSELLGMLLSYFSARYTPSSIMSLIFGLSPLISSLLALRILNELKFGPMRLIALVMVFTGLGIVCSFKLSLESDSWIALLLIFSAVSFLV